jgi:2-dehydro-3-deoxyphosphogluconate aldolase/(4S)-4-hydroxy-2-oxoglutarate aldolase
VEHAVPVFPGAATPTEIHRARTLGATAVKVFPAAQLGGPDYIRAIGSPLGWPAMVPTGGVEARDVRAYLDAGAVAVGAGGALFPSAALTSGDVAEIARRAAIWVEAAR